MTESQSTDILTIGVVTDLHCAPTTVGDRHCSQSLEKLRAAVHALRTHNLDVLINLGDLIDAADTVEEEIATIREAVDILDRVDAEKHHVLGNHDVSELTREQFLAACGRTCGYYSFDRRGVHIVILDSNYNADGEHFAPGNFHWSDAWIGEEQIAWLERDLASAGKRPVLVFCHANLGDRPRKNGNQNGHVVKDAEKVRQVLEAAGTVRAVFQGHDHRGHYQVLNGIPYIVLRAMVVGSGMSNTAYSVLSLRNGTDIELTGFGRQPSLVVTDSASCQILQTSPLASPPVVQSFGPDRFVVSIEVDRFATGRVEWGYAEDDLAHVSTPAIGGLVVANDTCLVIPVEMGDHAVPGKAVYYRVVADALIYSHAYQIDRVMSASTAVRRFVPPSTVQEAVSLVVVNDTHDRRRVMPHVVKCVEDIDPDMLVWNGDVCGEFNEGVSPAAIVLRPGQNGPTPSCGGWASGRPLLYVSGNHDVRGVRAWEFADLLGQGSEPALPYNKAFRMGPIAIVTLDAGEDKLDEHPVFNGMAAYELYRKRQADWLAAQLLRPEIAAAPFRIVFCHIPLRGSPGDGDGLTLDTSAKYSGHGARLWLPALINASFHAVISGHTHQWRIDHPTRACPITQIVGGGPSATTATVIALEATKSEMVITIRDLSGNLLARQTWAANGDTQFA